MSWLTITDLIESLSRGKPTCELLTVSLFSSSRLILCCGWERQWEAKFNWWSKMKQNCRKLPGNGPQSPFQCDKLQYFTVFDANCTNQPATEVKAVKMCIFDSVLKVLSSLLKSPNWVAFIYQLLHLFLLHVSLTLFPSSLLLLPLSLPFEVWCFYSIAFDNYSLGITAPVVLL